MFEAAHPLDGPADAGKDSPACFAGTGDGGLGLAEAAWPVDFPQQPAFEFVELLQAGGDGQKVKQQVVMGVGGSGRDAAFGVETE